MYGGMRVDVWRYEDGCMEVRWWMCVGKRGCMEVWE